MKITLSDSGRHETIEYEVFSVYTNKVSYIHRTTRELPKRPEDQKSRVREADTLTYNASS